MSGIYEPITESSLRSLAALGAVRGCTLLTLPGGAGYALSFSVIASTGRGMILRSHREPIRAFRNPAAAFRLVESMGLTSLSVSLSPVQPADLPSSTNRLVSQPAAESPVSQLANQRTDNFDDLPRHERRRLSREKAKRKAR